MRHRPPRRAIGDVWRGSTRPGLRTLVTMVPLTAARGPAGRLPFQAVEAGAGDSIEHMVTLQGARRAVVASVDSAARAGVSLVRRGHRTVILPAPTVNFGNFLYLWLQAYRAQQAGRNVVVAHNPRMDPWLALLPDVAQRLVVPRSDVSFFDRRSLSSHQCWGADYIPSDVQDFVRDVLLGSGLGLHPDDRGAGHVVVNIRRGDYYSPKFASRFAFNIPPYLEVALARSIAVGGPAESVHVVSDDIAWCRAHLETLFSARGLHVTYQPPDSGPVGDFAALAGARRLILTNSTFSYWGAHVSNTLFRANAEQVVVPLFHDRLVWEGEAYQLNPAWTVVSHVPGGWDPAPEDAPSALSATGAD